MNVPSIVSVDSVIGLSSSLLLEGFEVTAKDSTVKPAWRASWSLIRGSFLVGLLVVVVVVVVVFMFAHVWREIFDCSLSKGL